ncbi:hypothetical protein R1flu_017771 [Riccia fluitans]|uniref:Uncharacterized protein n=1 Tax=Riccia fluitans TaxID=41844 RepID=A0ABD1ZDX0_9MARC
MIMKTPASARTGRVTSPSSFPCNNCCAWTTDGLSRCGALVHYDIGLLTGCLSRGGNGTREDFFSFAPVFTRDDPITERRWQTPGF